MHFRLNISSSDRQAHGEREIIKLLGMNEIINVFYFALSPPFFIFFLLSATNIDSFIQLISQWLDLNCFSSTVRNCNSSFSCTLTHPFSYSHLHSLDSFSTFFCLAYTPFLCHTLAFIRALCFRSDQRLILFQHNFQWDMG